MAARLPSSRGLKRQERLMTARRTTTLVASFVVTLCSGTNYVFSAYGPQLGERLHITHTQLNLVAVAGNIGVYSSGPILGRMVDARGPSRILLSAFFLLLIGYAGIWGTFERGVPGGSGENEMQSLSTFAFGLLVVFSFLSGVGGDAGLAAAVNTTAKSFPEWARASTTGLVISGFGLSAFLFSTLAHVVFEGDTARFLLLLALGTSFPVLAGFWLVRVVPVGPLEGVRTGQGRRWERERATSVGSLALQDPDAETHVRLLDNDHLHLRPQLDGGLPEQDDGIVITPFRDGFVHEVHVEAEHRVLRGDMQDEEVSVFGMDGDHDMSLRREEEEPKPNIYGGALWRSPDFWLLFSVLSLVSGTGLMYINNVGSISQALFLAKTHAADTATAPRAAYDSVLSTRWQAAQVSWISVTNCAGRIAIGLLSDLLLSPPLRLPRSHALVLVSALALLSQVVAAFWVSDVENLWIVSALLGTAYGSAFSLAPTVCLEWFGLAHFSENWGYLALSPMVAGNLFSLAFGRNLDAHSTTTSAPSASLPTTTASSILSALPTNTSISIPARTSTSAPPTAPPARACLQGRACYVSSIYLTIAASVLAIALSVWASLRDRRKIEIAKTGRRRGGGMVLGTPRTGRGEIALGSASTSTPETGRGDIALTSAGIPGSARSGDGWEVNNNGRHGSGGV